MGCARKRTPPPPDTACCMHTGKPLLSIFMYCREQARNDNSQRCSCYWSVLHLTQACLDEDIHGVLVNEPPKHLPHRVQSGCQAPPLFAGYMCTGMPPSRIRSLFSTGTCGKSNYFCFGNRNCIFAPLFFSRFPVQKVFAFSCCFFSSFGRSSQYTGQPVSVAHRNG